MLHIAAVDPAVTISVIAAVFSPIAAYFIAAKRLSGKITNSDAEQLWEESRAIREWSKDRLIAQENEIIELRKTVDSLTKRVVELEDDKLELKDELQRSRRIIARFENERGGESGKT